jgi:PAS domain S-box-containing protein
MDDFTGHMFLDSGGASFSDFSLLESLPIGLLVADSGARVISVNDYVEQMLGYDRDELLGQSVEMLVPERLRIEHADLRRVFSASPRERAMGAGRDLCARRRDGTEIPVEIGLKPIQRAGRDYVLAVMVDISERKRLEERQRLLIGELNHRIQNLFAVVQSVALQSLRGDRSLEDAREAFIERLHSLGRTYTMRLSRNGAARHSGRLSLPRRRPLPTASTSLGLM